MDDLLGNTERNKDGMEKRGLHLLAVVEMKNGNLKTLEVHSLKMFKRIACNVSSVDNLLQCLGTEDGSKNDLAGLLFLHLVWWSDNDNSLIKLSRDNIIIFTSVLFQLTLCKR